MRLKIFFVLAFLSMGCLTLFGGDPIEEARQVSERAQALERLLDGLKQGERLDVDAKQRVIELLRELQTRDVELDVDTMIEDLQDGDPEAAADTARDLLLFLKSLREKVAELPDDQERRQPDGLEDILQAQKNIRQKIEDLLKSSANPLSQDIQAFHRKTQDFVERQAQIDSESSRLDELSRQADEGRQQPLMDFTGATSPQEARDRAQASKERLARAQDKLNRDMAELAKNIDNKASENKDSNPSDPQAQNHSRQLESAADDLEHNKAEQAEQKLAQLMNDIAREQLENMTPEEKKTIEHLQEKQRDLAEQLDQEAAKTDSPEESRSLHEAVDQMNAIANKVERGELDSGIWESKQLEEDLASLIEKMKFEQNRYAMDQRLVEMSDFINFVTELRIKQTDLHSLWKDPADPRAIADKTAQQQRDILAFASSKDESLAQAKSLSFTYGLNRVKRTLNEFHGVLLAGGLPDPDDQTRVEQDLQELIDGLKKLRGRLAEDSNRPDRRESHQGQDIEQPAVSIIEEIRYLRLLQMHLNQQRLVDPDNERWAKEQKELLDMLQKLRSRWIKLKEAES